MSSPERRLRFLQSAQIVFIGVCFFVKRIGSVETRDAIPLVQWCIIVAAIWSAISGFTVQRRINRSKKSSTLGRWRIGHVVRLSSATAVGLWGMLLFYTGGPDWLANVFLGLAMLLLLVWRPGVTPAEAQP
jgi:hypothetical protein